MSENVIDPVRETLKSILDLTGDLVKQLLGKWGKTNGLGP